jgi:CheY-like chemotaxis protein
MNDSSKRPIGSGPVLVVDDDADFLLLLSSIFKQSELTNKVITFNRGHDCLSYLERVTSSEVEFPELILLDFNMPGMDGIETLQLIRRMRAFQRIPTVIMLSSSDDQRDVDRSIQNGANDFMVKPFGFEDLIELVNSFAFLAITPQL